MRVDNAAGNMRAAGRAIKPRSPGAKRSSMPSVTRWRMSSAMSARLMSRNRASAATARYSLPDIARRVKDAILLSRHEGWVQNARR